MAKKTSKKGKAKRSAAQKAAAKRNIKKAQAALRAKNRGKKGKAKAKRGAKKGKAHRSAKQKAAAKRNIKKAQAALRKGRKGKGKAKSKAKAKRGAKKGKSKARKGKAKAKGRSKSAPRASAHNISTLRGEVQDLAKVVHSDHGKIKELEHDNKQNYEFARGVVNDVRQIKGLNPLKSLPGYKLPGYGATGGAPVHHTRVLSPALMGWKG